MNITIFIITLFVVVSVIYLLKQKNIIGSVEKSEASLRLRKICRGDEKQMGRLINYELKRSPSFSREKAMEMAVQRYLRDQ